jgi:hypothetical protein
MFFGLFFFIAVAVHSEPITLTFIEPRAFFENPRYYDYHWTYEVDEDGPYYFMSTPTYSYKFCETKEGAMTSLNCYYIIDTKTKREDEAAGINPGDGSKYLVETKRIPDSKKSEMWKVKDGVFTFARFDLSFRLQPAADEVSTKPLRRKP